MDRLTQIPGAPLAGGFRGDPFWDPVPFDWTLMLILVAICLLLTLAVVVWLVMQPEEPEHSTKHLVDDAVQRDHDRARTIHQRMNAESGRADAAQPDPR
ncbi:MULTISPECIES: hypothetical protein [unclassified Brachybacterium]|uniref:hypothetical protein n=1 Tax=unclassified Brachybacterium TaxID=2623841 RepID=UPI000C80A2DD|nr:MULTISPECIES: hypothetical protein [unclassified Brachybacterium]PMC74831.1 hypothetical protein CJ197_11085 [Brachybacterium sp. UMB0905]